MGKFKKETFKWLSEFLMTMAAGFLFLAISVIATAPSTPALLVLVVASFVVFAILIAASYGVRMLTV